MFLEQGTGFLHQTFVVSVELEQLCDRSAVTIVDISFQSEETLNSRQADDQIKTKYDGLARSPEAIVTVRAFGDYVDKQIERLFGQHDPQVRRHFLRVVRA